MENKDIINVLKLKKEIIKTNNMGFKKIMAIDLFIRFQKYDFDFCLINNLLEAMRLHILEERKEQIYLPIFSLNKNSQR